MYCNIFYKNKNTFPKEKLERKYKRENKNI